MEGPLGGTEDACHPGLAKRLWREVLVNATREAGNHENMAKLYFVFPEAETILDFSYLYIYLNLFFSPAPSLSKAFINLSDDKSSPREKLVSMTTT